jgi:hypothetical protein
VTKYLREADERDANHRVRGRQFRRLSEGSWICLYLFLTEICSSGTIISVRAANQNIDSVDPPSDPLGEQSLSVIFFPRLQCIITRI